MLWLASGDPSQDLPLGGREMVSHEEAAVLEQLTDLPRDPLLEPGRPRANLGASDARFLRSLATAPRIALVTSLRM